MNAIKAACGALGACSAALILAGCGGAQAPGGTALPAWQNARTLANLLPNALPSTGGDLLYLSARSAKGIGVFVFSYPTGTFIGQLNQHFEFPSGMCTDSQGNVFVTDYDAQAVYEFAHGGSTPVATLDDSPNYPSGCFINPGTGDLAVAGGDLIKQNNGNVAIFKNAQGSPTVYSDSYAGALLYCTYDGNGDIFVSGTAGVNELPAGSSSFRLIKISKELKGIGAVQWDGQYLAVGNSIDKRGQKNIEIYRVHISKNKGNVIGTVLLRIGKTNRPAQNAQFWISGSDIVSPKTYQKNVGLWAYPDGGKAISTIEEDYSDPRGVTISLGSSPKWPNSKRHPRGGL